MQIDHYFNTDSIKHSIFLAKDRNISFELNHRVQTQYIAKPVILLVSDMP